MIWSATPITFPGLGIEVNPGQGFTIPGTNFEIKWYGVIIALGVLLATLYACKRCREFGLTTDDIMNVVIVGVLCGIVGARLYYVVFYGTPWKDFFRIRDGGLAIYGAVIGAVLGFGVFSLTGRERRKKFLPSLDIAGLGLLIGQAIGRWGNFFNREAHGGETDSFLRMGLIEKGQQIYVHPTFLYESLWNAAGLILLHFLSKKRRFDGQTFLMYLVWYGLGRVWIEGLRTDSLYLGSFRVSQLLAGASALVGVGVIGYMLWVKKADPENMLVNQKKASEEAE